MPCLSLVSQFFLGSNLCCGFLISLFRRGALLIRRGTLLFCRGAFLIHCGALLLHRGGLLSGSGGLLLRRGGHLSCSGGLLLRRGGILSCSGGLLLHCGDPRTCLLCCGGPQLHPFCRLHHGPLFCRSCLSPKVLHLYMDLALRPYPYSASAPPPSWIV